MKKVFARDIPPRATLVVVALVLVASIVTGREEIPAAAVEAAPERTHEPPPTAAGQSVEIATRQRNDLGGTDLFASHSWILKPPPPPPTPALPVIAEPSPKPEPPSAPPLPFRYLGQLDARAGAVVFLLKGEDILMVRTGDSIENTYKVEAIAESAVEFIYLPLGTKQSLVIPATP
jgi:hypothetical protein